MNAPPIRIATRDSRLARWQAEHVAGLLCRVASERTIELVVVVTAGDRDRTAALNRLGGTGLFTREIQRAVLDGRADLAVHSLKDLPTEQFAGLILAAVPPRGPQFDALILRAGQPAPDAGQFDLLERLPRGARVGTGSLRRRAQLKHRRDDLAFVDLRGNVETRLRKLDDGDFDGLVLAEAGLVRLGLDERISVRLPPPVMLPAVGQGAIAVECRSDSLELLDLVGRISDLPSVAAVTAERTLLAELKAGCHAPLGAVGRIDEGRLSLEAVVLSADGRQRLVASATSAPGEAETLGRRVAAELLRQGAGELIGSPD